MGRNYKIKSKSAKGLALLLPIFILYYLSLPQPLFNSSLATLVLDENNKMLGARIAKDDQWRFAPIDSVPYKFEKCILNFEDQHFKFHPGYNVISIFNALKKNIKAGRVVSGGSTITMQLVRLSRNNPARTISEKLFELFLATRVEWSYSKNQILSMYASYAPFGGNIVGIEAASWRYYGRSPWDLSWSETATLAVLPNAPGLIHPGRNRNALKKKRNVLLKTLQLNGVITMQNYELALLEELPLKPIPLQDESPHLTDLLSKSQKGKKHYSTLNLDIQRSAIRSLKASQAKLSGNEVHNGAVLIINAKTGEVKAYVGNQSGKGTPYRFNDMIQTPRSSGSILKPFLYCSMLSEGSLWPKELLKDIPLLFSDFKPENFVNSFSGAVPADQALAKSLNIPFVFMLKNYGVERFLEDLKTWKFSSANRSAKDYGLSLILGGAEVKAWDLGGAYYNLQRHLNLYDESSGAAESPSNIHFLKHDVKERENLTFNRGAVYKTLNAMTEVVRPDSELGWQHFENGEVAWKTGTSYGHRDAWAVGITPNYIVVVWIGNSTGEGRPGLIGAQAAGPVLFDVLNGLPNSRKFIIPFDDLVQKEVCSLSGLPAGPYCTEVDTIDIPNVPNAKARCSYHQRVFVNETGEYRVHKACMSEGQMFAKNYFVLPPTMAWFYRRQNISYQVLPQWHTDCSGSENTLLEILYPKPGAKIFLPKDLGAIKQKVILEVSHQQPTIKLYWHLNDEYIGCTSDFHQLPIDLKPGEYKLHVEDENGNSMKSHFEVVQP